jgi:isochorismate hydrolase
MFKIGERVAPFDNMLMKGTIIDMRKQGSDQWMVGGAMTHIFIIKVILDDDKREMEFRADRLRRLD